MEVQGTLNAQERTRLAQWVKEHNSKIHEGKNPQQNLGKDDFLKSTLSPQEQAELAQWVKEYNSKIHEGKNPQQNLGKDDFLKLLITQLSYQDPTAPMEDKEFIAQMAQFSTLDQMTSMATDFSRLAALVAGSEATGALGKSVEIAVGDKLIQGTVKAVTRGNNPEVLVQGSYYSWNQVTKVLEE